MHWRDIKGISPISYAQDVIFRLKINALPVIAQDVAEKLGIAYAEVDLGPKVDASLRRRGDRALLAVNSTIKYDGRKNFSGGHEIGHCVIAGHDSDEYSCTTNDFHAYNSFGRQAEREANEFAAELLMPTNLVTDFLRTRSFCFETIQELSEKCRVSLTSAAIKITKLADDPCAVVLSKGRKIQWSCKSRYLRSNVKKGSLHEYTHACGIFSGSVCDMNKPDLVLPSAWLYDTERLKGAQLFEHSIRFPELNMVLTLLSVESQDDFDYEYDEG